MTDIRDYLTPAFYLVSLLTLAWDVMVLSRLGQSRHLPSFLRGTSALAALLVLAAITVLVASSTIQTGRAVVGVAWLWPVTTLLFAIQALYALARRHVSALVGVPIVLLDILLFAVATTRYLESIGRELGIGTLALGAAHTNALGLLLVNAALTSPFAIIIPMAAPAYPARWRVSAFVRTFFGSLAFTWVALLLLQLPPAVAAVSSYERYAQERLQERPQGDFAVGVRLLPTLRGMPPAMPLRNDLALLDTIDADVIGVNLAPEGAKVGPLDSLAKSVEDLRQDSILFAVSYGYAKDAPHGVRSLDDAYTRQRLDDVDRIARRLRPDFFLPALDPYGAGTQSLGVQSTDYWIGYLTRAATIAHRDFPSIKVALSISAFDQRDSVLYAWAASKGSPIDVIGFRFFPSFAGGRALEARLATADRWMRTAGSTKKEHWVFSSGGYPLAHGERSQERVVWRTLAWATSHANVRGLIVADAGDYGSETGIRAPGGRLRSVVTTIARAIRQLRENAAAKGT